MDDLTAAILNAWSQVAPGLLANPDELQRRLARRQSKLFLRPLRAFCIAARANDLRINDTHALIYPRTALDPRHTGRYAEHTVALDKPLLERICASVKICPPGEPADHVAQKLGCTPRSLMNLRRTGFLYTNPKPGLMGRHGPPVPLVYSPEYLDPQSSTRAGADDIFACSWRTNPELIPDGFTQTITRIPVYRHIRGQDRFRGWFWVCPACRQSAQILFYPVHHPDLPTFLGFPPATATPLPQPTPIFACRPCHGILGFSRINLAQNWNILILRLTGGLLFGHEVEKPAFLTPHRQRPHHPRAARPAPTRSHVQRLLLTTTLTYPQLATHLNVSLTTIRHHVDKIYKLHNVHTRQDLRALLNPPTQSHQAAAG